MDLIDEHAELLASIPAARLEAAMTDLYFDWRNSQTMTKGQLKVVIKRMRQASRKTMQDFESEARSSEIIISMRKSLENLRENKRKYG